MHMLINNCVSRGDWVAIVGIGTIVLIGILYFTFLAWTFKQ